MAASSSLLASLRALLSLAAISLSRSYLQAQGRKGSPQGVQEGPLSLHVTVDLSSLCRQHDPGRISEEFRSDDDISS